MADLNRREFVAAAALATAACFCAFSCPSQLLAADAPADDATTLDVGAKTDYTKDGVTSTWIKSNKVVVVRQNGKIIAFSAVCTHKGGIVKEDGDHLTCPRHHATFALDGSVTNGPARVSLDHYAIAPDANGHLIVDKSKTFDDTQWNDAASFVKVDDK